MIIFKGRFLYYTMSSNVGKIPKIYNDIMTYSWPQISILCLTRCHLAYSFMFWIYLTEMIMHFNLSGGLMHWSAKVSFGLWVAISILCWTSIQALFNTAVQSLACWRASWWNFLFPSANLVSNLALLCSWARLSLCFWLLVSCSSSHRCCIYMDNKLKIQ